MDEDNEVLGKEDSNPKSKSDQNKPSSVANKPKLTPLEESQKRYEVAELKLKTLQSAIDEEKQIINQLKTQKKSFQKLEDKVKQDPGGASLQDLNELAEKQDSIIKPLQEGLEKARELRKQAAKEYQTARLDILKARKELLERRHLMLKAKFDQLEDPKSKKGQQLEFDMKTNQILLDDVMHKLNKQTQHEDKNKGLFSDDIKKAEKYLNKQNKRIKKEKALNGALPTLSAKQRGKMVGKNLIDPKTYHVDPTDLKTEGEQLAAVIANVIALLVSLPYMAISTGKSIKNLATKGVEYAQNSIQQIKESHNQKSDPDKELQKTLDSCESLIENFKQQSDSLDEEDLLEETEDLASDLQEELTQLNGPDPLLKQQQKLLDQSPTSKSDSVKPLNVPQNIIDKYADELAGGMLEGVSGPAKENGQTAKQDYLQNLLNSACNDLTVSQLTSFLSDPNRPGSQSFNQELSSPDLSSQTEVNPSDLLQQENLSSIKMDPNLLGNDLDSPKLAPLQSSNQESNQDVEKTPEEQQLDDFQKMIAKKGVQVALNSMGVPPPADEMLAGPIVDKAFEMKEQLEDNNLTQVITQAPKMMGELVDGLNDAIQEEIEQNSSEESNDYNPEKTKEACTQCFEDVFEFLNLPDKNYALEVMKAQNQDLTPQQGLSKQSRSQSFDETVLQNKQELDTSSQNTPKRRMTF